MAKNRKSTIPILVDIRFNGSLNKFEETYGDHVSYAEIEQESYIDLKGMIFEKINPNIKIRKFNREKNVLTLKADMLEKEYQLLQDILAEKVISESETKNKKTNPEGIEIKEKFNFLHDFIISNVKIMTNEDLIKLKKSIPLTEEDDEIKTEESAIIEVSLDEAEDLSDEDFD
jgi:hypothetical protein